MSSIPWLSIHFIHIFPIVDDAGVLGQWICHLKWWLLAFFVICCSPLYIPRLPIESQLLPRLPAVMDSVFMHTQVSMNYNNIITSCAVIIFFDCEVTNKRFSHFKVFLRISWKVRMCHMRRLAFARFTNTRRISFSTFQIVRMTLHSWPLEWQTLNFFFKFKMIHICAFSFLILYKFLNPFAKLNNVAVKL